MHLVFFEQKLINDFLGANTSLRFNEGSAHANIYKIIKSYPEYQTKYNEQFFDNLKRFLRDYRYCIVDDLSKIAGLKNILTMELPNDFPYEAILDKKYFEEEKQKIDDHKNKVWELIGQLKIQYDQQAQQTNTDDSYEERIETNHDQLEIGNENISLISCAPFKKWFNQCWARLFFSHHNYAHLSTMSMNSDENPREKRRHSQ